MKNIFSTLLLLLLISCVNAAKQDNTKQSCSQWVIDQVPKESLVKKVSISEVDKYYKSQPSSCMRNEWENIKASLEDGDEIWVYSRLFSDGGYAVVREGVPTKAIIQWVN